MKIRTHFKHNVFMLNEAGEELSPTLGDGRGQAAAA